MGYKLILLDVKEKYLRQDSLKYLDNNYWHNLSIKTYSFG